MSPEEFLNNIQQKSDKIAYAFERRIPLMVGNPTSNPTSKRAVLSTKTSKNGNPPNASVKPKALRVNTVRSSPLVTTSTTPSTTVSFLTR